MDAQPVVPDTTSDVGPAPSNSSGLQLLDLQPDVLHNILHFLENPDLAHLCLASRRLASNTLQACQHWAPKVECWLLADPARTDLLQRLRMAAPVAHDNNMVNGPEPAPVGSDQQQAPRAAAPVLHQQSAQQLPLQHNQKVPAGDGRLQQGVCKQLTAAYGLAKQPQVPKRVNWRQVWNCIQRAQQGPWQLDVQALTPAAAPNGVLLTFELLLQQPAPYVDPGSSEQQAMGAKDSVTVISFVLDKKPVEIVVDASGRVTSPQRDWSQGCIQLHPGQPRLVALEISYIMPVPAWFLHPCTLAAPRPCSSSRGCCGSCASSMSGMTLDQTWESYSTGTSSGSSMSISSSIALCSSAAGMSADSRSLATTSLTSSGSLGNIASAASGSSGICSCRGDGRPRLSLDLSCGFGTYVSDPRYIDAAQHKQPRGLERMELSSRVCWKPSKVQSWLGRLLPGIRGHSSSSTGNSSPRASHHAGSSTGAGSSAAIAACPLSSRSGAKPSFAVNLSKVAAWQVPSDTDRRFAEGFLFWAVQHKLEQQLKHYGILQQGNSRHSGSADSSTSSTLSCQACMPAAAEPAAPHK